MHEFFIPHFAKPIAVGFRRLSLFRHLAMELLLQYVIE
jgi:hypothetical protein